MENFNKFKDWLLNLFAVAIIGGLYSIKSDLSEIKEEFPLTKYRIEQLEKKQEGFNGKSKTVKIEKPREFILPDELVIEEVKPN